MIKNEKKSISKEEWIAKIEKELKVSSWENRYVPLTEELKVPPALHIDDAAGKDWAPVITSRNFDPFIALDIGVEDSTKANDALTKALQLGLESPGLIIDKNWDEDVEALFKNIQCDWLVWKLIGAEGHISVIQNYFEAWEVKVKVYIFTEVHHESVAESLERFVRKLLDWSSEESESEHCFSVELGSNYLIEIAKLRAMRRLYSNFCDPMGQSQKSFFLDVLTEAKPSDRSEDSQLIANTTMAMSAYLGGADRISVKAADFPKNTDFRIRLALTLQHVLKMESHFNKVIDPLCGSIWIENATDELARSYWSKLQILVE